MVIAEAETAAGCVGGWWVKVLSSCDGRRVLAHDTRDMLHSPLGSATGTQFASIKLRCNAAQGMTTISKLADLADNRLFALVWLQMLAVRTEPVAEGDVTYSFSVTALMAHRVARPFADRFPLPLAHGGHDIQYQPSRCRARIQALRDRYQRHAVAVESFERSTKILHASGQAIQLRNDHPWQLRGRRPVAAATLAIRAPSKRTNE